MKSINISIKKEHGIWYVYCDMGRRCNKSLSIAMSELGELIDQPDDIIALEPDYFSQTFGEISQLVKDMNEIGIKENG